MSKGTELTMNIDFRDWKYMSNVISFKKKITDVEIILGNREGSLDIDFSKIVQKDKTMGSKFEIGGRVFWEAYVSSFQFQAFVTNGFFDREGYEEPTLSSGSVGTFVSNYLVIIIGVMLIIAIILC